MSDAMKHPAEDAGTVVWAAPPPLGRGTDARENDNCTVVGSWKPRRQGARAGWESVQALSADELLGRWSLHGAEADVPSALYEGLLPGKSPEGADAPPGVVGGQTLLRRVGAAPGEDGGPPAGLPEVGDELFGFRLLQELGHGAFARVFLARRGGPDNPLVVLKVSPIVGSEPETLAQLRHEHIVPMSAVYEDAAAGLRALCMPYFGGANLRHVLEDLWHGDRPPARGADLLRALARVGIPAPAAASPEGDADGPTAQEVIGSTSYVRAAAWVVSRLAGALQHAHQHGVLHRDVKPANILLSADARPLLLDFNVSQESDGDPADATLGGTVSYMAPEHLRALLGEPARVDHRSDIYSLGMVLYEMLTGQKPFDQTVSYAADTLHIQAMIRERSQTVPSPRACRADVPRRLESVVQKCLAPEPARRYQHAEHLAEDLCRFLAGRPLKHAAEPSREAA